MTTLIDEDDITTINEDVQTIEYAPAIFEAIRKMDKITDAMIQKSLNPELNQTQVFKAKESAGKSGSFFFFSYDKQFLIKTMNDNEMAVFVKSLPKYYEHLRENKNSLLARIYGIFTVNMEDLTPVHILLMANSAQTGSEIKNVFDLKGSIINREVKIDSKTVPTSCLKDVNILNLAKEDNLLLFRPKDRDHIMAHIA